MEEQSARIKYVRRLMTRYAVLISVAVFAFAAFTISATDDMTANTESLYSRGYDEMSAARQLQTALLRVTSRVEEYINNPEADLGSEVLSELYAWQRKMVQAPDAFSTLVTEESRKRIQNTLRALMTAQDRTVELVHDGESERAREVFENEVTPLAAEMDETLERVIADSAQSLQDALRQTQRMNSQLNLNAVIVACVVVGMCITVTALVGRNVAAGNEEAYRKEVLFNMIARNADDVFEIYDTSEGNIGYASENIERLFGVTAADYTHDPDELRQYIDSADLDKLRKVYSDGALSDSTEIDFRYHHPDKGSQQTFHSTIYPVPPQKGEHGYHVMLTRDVTEERTSESRLRQAVMDAKTAEGSRRAFLTQMSDKLVTPLTAMRNLTTSDMPVDDPELMQSFMNKVRGQAGELLNLTEGLIFYAKHEGGDIELKYNAFDLDGLIQIIAMRARAAMSEKGKDQTFRIDTIDCAVRYLVGDESLLRRTLLNLLYNAISYTPSNGDVRLTIQQFPPEAGFVRMLFTVSDTGRGIPDEQLEALKEALHGNSIAIGGKAGVGLGLYRCHTIVHAMGGTMEVSSQSGAGSEFSFEVSFGVAAHTQQTAGRNVSYDYTAKTSEVIIEGGQSGKTTGTDEADHTESASNTEDQIVSHADSTAAALAESSPPHEHALMDEQDDKPRLLLSDDNELNRELAHELLEEGGFQVDDTENGLEALTRFEESPQGWYSAVIMDIQMPVMDGRTATRKMRESSVRNGRDAVILSMSADPFVADTEFEGLLFDGHLDKAIISAELLRKMIMDAIEKKRGKNSGL